MKDSPPSVGVGGGVVSVSRNNSVSVVTKPNLLSKYQSKRNLGAATTTTITADVGCDKVEGRDERSTSNASAERSHCSRDGATDSITISSKASSISSSKSKQSIRQRIKNAIGRKVTEHKDVREESPPVSSIHIAVEVKGEGDTKQQVRKKKKLKQTKEEVAAPEVTLENEVQQQQQQQQFTALEQDFQLKSSNSSPWMGRVVGLRLPSTVDPTFDETCKPNGRRVDPSLFCQDKNKKCGSSGWNPWEQGNDSRRSCLDDRHRNFFSFHHSDYDYYPDNDDKCQISIDVHLFNTKDASMKIHMTRDSSESVDKTLQRLQISMEKKLSKTKKKKKGKQQVASVNPILWRKRQEVVKETSYFEDLTDIIPINLCNPFSRATITREDTSVSEERGAEYERLDDVSAFSIEDLLKRANKENFGKYAISVPIELSDFKTMHVPLMVDPCPPTITSVATFGSFEHTRLFEKTPLVVEVGLLFAKKAKITWFAGGEEVCHDNHCYTPTKSDVGKVLTVVITPLRPGHDGKGCEEAYQFKRPVETLPHLPILSPLRDEFIVHRDRQQEDKQPLRVVSYNILADQNASRDVKRDVDDKIYSHCKLDDIVKWRRHPLILHEILQYQGDIVCLQEVDRDVFDGLLKPCLTAHGYQGYYSEKGLDDASGVREGCATFWSLDVFESVRLPDMKTHTFRDMFKQFMCDKRLHKTEWRTLKDVANLLDEHDHLKHVLFNKLGHVLQTVVLTDKRKKEKVLVANTHLFYHPHASHVKCLKMLIACRQLEIEHIENEHSPMIFCGDYNSTPNSGVMELLLNRFVDAGNEETWKHLCTYEWEEGAGGDLKHVNSIDLEYPASFPQLMSAYESAPEFTHFIECFAATLDYILASSNFQVLRSASTLSFDDMAEHVAMPNEFMASDHISLVADLSFGN
jgi:mRNA deadenylase 3'-5' endonuclease subunit Ccr4